jgi:hypothetical protein
MEDRKLNNFKSYTPGYLLLSDAPSLSEFGVLRAISVFACAFDSSYGASSPAGFPTCGLAAVYPRRHSPQITLSNSIMANFARDF